MVKQYTLAEARKKLGKSSNRKKTTTLNVGKIIAAALAATQVAPSVTKVLLEGKFDRVGVAAGYDLAALPQNPMRAVKATLPLIGYGLFRGAVKWQDREVIKVGNFKVSA